MDIAVVPFTPADGAAVRQAHDIVRAAARADLPDFPNPTREAFEGSLRHAWPGRGFEWALAMLDGVPAGYLELGLPQRDNVGNVNAELHVLPALRRRGVGSALHAYAVARTRALGRQRILGVTAVQSPAGDVPGPIFAARTGADAALDEARSRLDVAGVDQGELDRLLKDAWGRADGYRLVQWTGRAPDDVVAAVAYLEGRLNTDAPTGDVAWEAEAVDAEQVRAIEAAREARLRRTHHSGVVHVAGGRLVGWTHLVLTGGQVRHAWQDTTIVDPEHRGHRLGLLVKIENLRYALRHEPGLQVIDTFNAAENAHMIAINEAMGFRRVDMWMQWQLTL
jgi:GNAT superfamily N-acetyltransferase/RimJ/RimL family protein N-acetyltransferase